MVQFSGKQSEGEVVATFNSLNITDYGSERRGSSCEVFICQFLSTVNIPGLRIRTFLVGSGKFSPDPYPIGTLAM